MAVIYYPSDAGYLSRQVSGSNYTEVFITVHPDSIFFFNDQGFLTSSYGSASFCYTASYAFTASALNFIPNASTFATQSLYATQSTFATSSTQATSASFASSSISSSNATTSSYVAIGKSVVLCSAFTPTSTGGDAAEIVIPFSPTDGSSSLSWNIKRLSLRTQTAESSTSSLSIEKSTSTGSFSATSVGTVTLFSGSFETATTGSLGTILSGNKIRFNVSTLGTATNWTVITEISNS